MTLGVFLAVIVAAFLHAAWNAAIKLGASKLGAMLIFSVVEGAIGLAVLAWRPFPEAQVWLWLIGSALIHFAYKMFLVAAYEHGDLSRVYPIARGAAPLIVLVAGVPLLPDALSGAQAAGIVVMGAGLLGMARGVFANGESRRLLPFALGSACATAGYTLADGMGARVSGDAVAYVAWIFLLDGIAFSTVCILWKGRRVVLAGRRAWATGTLAAAASYAAYAIAVWAMTVAPIALVSALRETSILFAVLIGWLAFGERLDRGKGIAAALILGGVALTRL